MVKKLFPSLAMTAALLGCSTPKTGHTPLAASNSQLVVDGKLWASLFQQKAAEYQALCLQAYHIARSSLDEALLQPGTRPLAVVTDIDETVLDNSAYAVHQALQYKDYAPASWAQWTARSEADTLPGAVAFFNYAAAHHTEVFYITNRVEKEKASTIRNLQRYGFPFADEGHLMLRQPESSSSKEERRKTLAQTHRIVLLLGDNLADFSSLFDKKTPAERAAAVSAAAGDFGKKFILLPNAAYGDWEAALYQYNYQLSPAQKDSVIRANVKSY